MPKYFLICLILLFSTATKAVTVRIEMESDIVEIDNMFSVNIKGNDFPKVGGATLGLMFNRSVIKVKKVYLGEDSVFADLVHTEFNNITEEGGLISILAPLTGDLPEKDFNAFSIDFQAIGEGFSTIKLVDDGLIKGWTASDFSIISGVNYQQGSVTVTSIPLPTTIFLMLTSIGTLSYKRLF